MIGRGTYGRPWFIAQVMEYLRSGVRPDDPALEQQLETVLSHYDAMLAHYPTEVAVKMARKHIGWYTKGLPGSAAFRAHVFSLDGAAQVRDAIGTYYAPLTERLAA